MRSNLFVHEDINICLRASTNKRKQQQMPAFFRQMFQKPAKTTTNTGKSPANVPNTSQNSNKRRKISRKCSKNQPKQQQTPEFFRQMFQKTTKTTTNAGEKSPENVPQKIALKLVVEREFVLFATTAANAATASKNIELLLIRRIGFRSIRYESSSTLASKQLTRTL